MTSSDPTVNRQGPPAPPAPPDPPDLLNLGILAHVDAGKTSLTERLLFEAGVVDDPGSVDAGNTQTDTMLLERRRGITIRSAVVSFVVDDVTVNLIDTPGHSDFIAEVERSLAALDGVVLVVSGVEGVQAQTLVLFRALQRLGIPTVFFVNKLDRPSARPAQVLAEIRARLTPWAVPVGSRDIDGASLEELIAEHDEEVLASLVNERHAYPRAELERRLALLSRRGFVHPVFFGSAITGLGVPDLMHSLGTFLPTSGGSPDAPLSGEVFKIDRGDAGEKVTYLRLFAGRLHVRDRLDLGRGTAERITAAKVFGPSGLATTGEVLAGQIAQVRGLELAQIGDTFGAVADVPRGQFVRPSLEAVVEPVDPCQRGTLYAALGQLAEQDPLIDLRQDDGRREISVSLYGEVQKEVVGSLLEAEHGVEVTFRESTPICVERLLGPASDSETIATPTNPFLATVGLRVEPALVGTGVDFRLEVELGSMPLAFFTAVEDSVRATLLQGPHGWEVPDCIVTMTHSGYWGRHSIGHADFTKSISSTAADYRYLAPLVLMTAMLSAHTVVCEPIHRFELELPQSAYPSVLAMLPLVRGVPLETTQRDGLLVVTGDVPAVSVHALQQRVPDLTRGEGLLTTSLHHFSPVVGLPPTRPRTDDDPTDRTNFLKATTRRVGRRWSET